MAKPGRKSAAELSVATSSIERPKPPAALTRAQKAEWKAIVAEKGPGDYARDKHPLLESYCVHVVTRRKLDKLVNEIEAQDDPDKQQYDHLTKMRDRETKQIAALARALGIASSYERKGELKSKGNNRRPWQT